jgi:hypothetical protein
MCRSKQLDTFFREHLTLSAADSFHQTVMLSDPVAEAGLQ